MAFRKVEEERLRAILKIRAQVIDFFRAWLKKKGFIEVQGPILIPSFDNSSTNFAVSYFDKKVSLSGGLQPYSDTFLEFFDKIFTIAPTFRAEPLETGRHLIEFWRTEVFGLNFSFEDVLSLQEQMVADSCYTIANEEENNLEKVSKGALERLKRTKKPFPRITYSRAIEKLQNEGVKVFWGEPLNHESENRLSSMFSQPFFITEFPLSGETFFHKSVYRKPELTLSFDLIAPGGYGEIAGGGQLITEKELIKRKLKALEITSEGQRWYMGLKKFSAEPQSGFSLGVERYLNWIFGFESINQTIAFPRTNILGYP